MSQGEQKYKGTEKDLRERVPRREGKGLSWLPPALALYSDPLALGKHGIHLAKELPQSELTNVYSTKQIAWCFNHSPLLSAPTIAHRVPSVFRGTGVVVKATHFIRTYTCTLSLFHTRPKNFGWTTLNLFIPPPPSLPLPVYFPWKLSTQCAAKREKVLQTTRGMSLRISE